MNVQEFRDALQTIPGHLPVHVAVPADGSGGGADEDFLFVLECALESLPTNGRFQTGGRMVVIRINQEPR